MAETGPVIRRKHLVQSPNTLQPHLTPNDPEKNNTVRVTLENTICDCSPRRMRWPLYLVITLLALWYFLPFNFRSLLTSPELPVGAVTADNVDCSNVGKQMLLRGGSAVDAAIAALLCTGVRTPHSMGIGGGCFFVIYDKKSRKTVTINGRERAPLHPDEDYMRNSIDNRDGRFIVTPGEIKAYKAAHDMFGRLPWRDLFQPAIEMTKGSPLSAGTERAIRMTEERRQVLVGRYPNKTIIDMQPLLDFFSHKSLETLKAGATVRMPALGRTLSNIAIYGPDYLYNSEATDRLVEELRKTGCQLTKDDFVRYRPIISSPEEFRIANLTMLTSSAYSSGPQFGLLMKIFEAINFTPDSLSNPEKTAQTIHYMSEAFKFAFAQKDSLGDPELEPEQVAELIEKWKSTEFAQSILKRIDPSRTYNLSHYTGGDEPRQVHTSDDTTHVSVLGPDGDAVSVTTSIDLYFGTMVFSKEFGIIFNSHGTEFNMPDRFNKFSMKRASNNEARPGKRPRSSMAPALFIDETGDVRVVVGAAGGVRIMTIMAQVLARVMWMGQSLNTAMSVKRFHHQLHPNRIEKEANMKLNVTRLLKSKYGHRLLTNQQFLGVVQSILKHKDGRIDAVADKRKPPGKGVLIYPSEFTKSSSSL